VSAGPDLIIGRLKAIRDTRMRVLALVQALGEGDPVAWVEALASIIARAHLVGQSLGGAVSVQATLDEPGRIASLTLVCPAGLGEEINAAYLQGFIDAQRPMALKALLAELFADPGLISRDMVEDLLKYKRLDGVDRALRTIVGAVAPDGRQVLSYRDALGRLEQPVQVIWGTEDRIIPSSHADGLPDSVPVHRIAGKGHMVHMEAAAEVNRLLAAFLRAV